VAVRGGTPLLVASIRFVAAGLVVMALGRLRGHPLPRREHVRGIAILALLMFLLAYGPLFWAEQRMASGTAAVLVATMPFWLVLLEAGLGHASLRDPRLVAGLLTGFLGAALLLSGGPQVEGGDTVAGAAAITMGCVAWALGTVLMRRLVLPPSREMAAGAEMLVGGLMLGVAAALAGEGGRVTPDLWSPAVLLSLFWLVTAGSVVAFLAYVWLVEREPLARVSTYAYVNPVVALAVGWWLGEERITLSVLAGGALVVAGVAAILTAKKAG
jgi:drug/metabolite transporter (DMT)-like permease